MTTNKSVFNWLDEMFALLNPDEVVWVDDADAQIADLRAQAGEIKEEADENVKTWICSNGKDCGCGNWKSPTEAYEMLCDIVRGSYKGRTMYIVPCALGTAAALDTIGVEITDSVQDVVKIAEKRLVGQAVWNALGDGIHWAKALHITGAKDADKRYVCHLTDANVNIAVNTTDGSDLFYVK